MTPLLNVRNWGNVWFHPQRITALQVALQDGTAWIESYGSLDRERGAHDFTIRIHTGDLSTTAIAEDLGPVNCYPKQNSSTMTELGVILPWVTALECLVHLADQPLLGTIKDCCDSQAPCGFLRGGSREQ